MKKGFDPTEEFGFGIKTELGITKTLAGRFIIPPFSILSARSADWLNRKKAWLSLGIESELGRECHTYHQDSLNRILGQKNSGSTLKTGISVFDPVLCELVYRWFCPDEGSVLDVCCGGSVRGIVAALLGHPYTGIDLRKEQVESNREQWQTLTDKHKPKAPDPEWIAGDGRKVKQAVGKRKFDLFFTCPPYGNLEKYSEEADDLSTMDYPDFIANLDVMIRRALMRIKKNRFACIVVGDFRDKKTGGLYNFPKDVVDIFERSDFNYYNEAILMSGVGSAAIRASNQFPKGRKLLRVHQHLLVFYKGDMSKIVEHFGNL